MICTGKLNNMINDLTNNIQYIPNNDAIIDKNICSKNNFSNGFFIYFYLILGYICENLDYSLLRIQSLDINQRAIIDSFVNIQNSEKNFENRLNMLKEWNYDQNG